MRYDEDYLARKIVEEQVDVYNSYVRQRQVYARKAYLIALTVALGFSSLFSLLFVRVGTIPLFLLSLYFTVKYCKKHSRKNHRSSSSNAYAPTEERKEKGGFFRSLLRGANWLFSVLCFLFVLTYGVSLSSFLFLLTGIASLPIAVVRNVWNRLPGELGKLKFLAVALAFIAAVFNAPV